MKSFGTQLVYECGIARKFYDESNNETYDQRSMVCNWNKTWTEYDTLDKCIWVQCINPPQPPTSSNLKLIWDGNPVNFTHSVSYVCKDEDLYFEWDRDMQEYLVQCLHGGGWNAPDVWPVCLHCK